MYPRVAGESAEAPRRQDIASFRRIWMASPRAQDGLAYFEHVAVGELGEAANRTALFRRESDGQWRVLRRGPAFSSWFAVESGEILDEGASIESEVLGGGLRRARDSAEPDLTTLPASIEGALELLDVLTLPLATRWEFELSMVVVEKRRRRANIANALTEFCNEGLIAIAPFKGASAAMVEFRVLSANRAAAELLGISRDALVGGRATELLALLGLQGEAITAFRASFAERKPRQFAARVRRNGEVIELQVGVSLAEDMLAVTLTDVSEIKAREQSFRLLFDANPLPMMICDPDTLVVEQANEATAALYGVDAASMESLSLPKFWPDASADLLRGLVERNSTTEPVGQFAVDGRHIDALVYARRLPRSDSDACLLAMVDVTERRRAEARIFHLAHHDVLTGLNNRAAFRERLESELASANPSPLIAVVYLDLDRFKDVNDTLGHPSGDWLLREVAVRLKASARKEDVVARFGGDEFAILCLHVMARADLVALCERLVAAVAAPFDIDGQEVSVGVSVGVALAPDDSGDPDVLLKYADLALYSAKAQGGACYCFFEEPMERRLRERNGMETSLRRALEAGEFVLYYQPTFATVDLSITGFEALMRWNRPGHGLVPPAQFIPLAEENGLIVEIGEWALVQACRDAALWPSELSVAVNVSPAQLRNRRLAQSVLRALAASLLRPSRLELEITETALFADADISLQTLKQLQDVGVRIAMDDFGVGYSSLSYLRKLAFDKIKIDRSFVRDAASNKHSRAIIRAVIGLGESLDVAITAEGVETEAQLEFLRAERCMEAQGYLISRPMPFEAIGEFLDRHNARARAA